MISSNKLPTATGLDHWLWVQMLQHLTNVVHKSIQTHKSDLTIVCLFMFCLMSFWRGMESHNFWGFCKGVMFVISAMLALYGLQLSKLYLSIFQQPWGKGNFGNHSTRNKKYNANVQRLEEKVRVPEDEVASRQFEVLCSYRWSFCWIH